MIVLSHPPSGYHHQQFRTPLSRYFFFLPGDGCYVAVAGIADFTTATDLLRAIAEKRGKLLRGGQPDVEAAALCLLKDWNSGLIEYYSMPPAPETSSQCDLLAKSAYGNCHTRWSRLLTHTRWSRLLTFSRVWQSAGNDCCLHVCHRVQDRRHVIHRCLFHNKSCHKFGQPVVGQEPNLTCLAGV